MTMTRGKSPTSTVVGFALLLNLITGPFLTVLFYGTTLDEKFLVYFPSKTAKNFWRVTSLMTCWVVLVAEEAFSIYERFKLSERVRKMLRRSTIFRKASNWSANLVSIVAYTVSDSVKNKESHNPRAGKSSCDKEDVRKFDNLTAERRSLLTKYYCMIELDMDRLNNLCARESSIQLVLQ